MFLMFLCPSNCITYGMSLVFVYSIFALIRCEQLFLIPKKLFTKFICDLTDIIELGGKDKDLSD